VAATAWTLLAGATPIGRLELEVAKLRSDKGTLRICVTADPQNFPKCVNDTRALRRNLPATARATRFEGLPAGDYAVAVIHDENGNKKLDTALGIPREGFGFSRNPAIGFGPPSFTAARFRVNDGDEEQTIKMRYLL
jgi:uncharacterized protein (DUF2141 family)